MLRIFNRTSRLRDSTVAFLNEADREYMKAFATGSMRRLSRYMTRDCAVRLSRRLYSAYRRNFGAPRFRRTTWILRSESLSGRKVILKKVVFDKIKIRGALKIAAAEDYLEEWVLVSEDRKLKIDSIVEQRQGRRK